MQIRTLTLSVSLGAALAATGCAERHATAVAPAAATPQQATRFYTPRDAATPAVGQPVQPISPAYGSANPPAYGTQTPVPGARAARPDEAPQSPTQLPSNGPRTFNSDNRSTYSRSGLNSDPDNPNGAPGPTVRSGM